VCIITTKFSLVQYIFIAGIDIVFLKSARLQVSANEIYNLAGFTKDL